VPGSGTLAGLVALRVPVISRVGSGCRSWLAREGWLVRGWMIRRLGWSLELGLRLG
jgi:hypothetical protein